MHSGTVAFNGSQAEALAMALEGPRQMGLEHLGTSWNSNTLIGVGRRRYQLAQLININDICCGECFNHHCSDHLLSIRTSISEAYPDVRIFR